MQSIYNMHRFVDMSQSILHKYHVVELLYIIIDTTEVKICRTLFFFCSQFFFGRTQPTEF